MCNNHKHKLQNLLKLSQVQMKLFPHQTVDERSSTSFGNMIDDDTGICCICREIIPFPINKAKEIPDDYSLDSEYMYVSTSNLKYSAIDNDGMCIISLDLLLSFLLSSCCHIFINLVLLLAQFSS